MTSPILRHFTFRLPELAEVGRRFPMAVAATVVLAVYYLLGLHATSRWPTEVAGVRVPTGLIAAFIWAFGVALYGEAHAREARTTYALTAAGWLVIALMWVLGDAIGLSPGVLVAAASVALACAAYLVPAKRNSAFWQFNHDFWFGWLASVIALALFAGGVSIIFESLRYLFGLTIPYWLHEKVWIIASFLIAPLYWLRQTPADFSQPVAEGEPKEVVSRLIAVLSKFILVPLLLTYTAILHAYALKIGIDGSLPKGRLGWMVLSFGAVLAATALLTYPTRQSGGRVVQLFWRFWPWLLVVPVGLLFLAVGSRVKQYGLTESRYFVVLAGIWLTSLVATQGFAGENRRDLRLIPGALAALLAIASFGPWGATGWSNRSQVRELSARLDAAGMLKNGRVPADARPTTTLLQSDRQHMHGAIDYLMRQGRLDALRPLFDGEASDPFEGVMPGTRRRYDTALAGKVRERLGLGRNLPDGGRRNVSYHASQPAPIPLSGAAEIVGPLNLNTSTTTRRTTLKAPTSAGEYVLTLENNVVTISNAAGRTATFDLASFSADDGPFSTKPGALDKRTPRRIARTAGELPVAILLLGSSGSQTESGIVDVSYLQFWLLLER